jgi:hypothetical protein
MMASNQHDPLFCVGRQRRKWANFLPIVSYDPVLQLARFCYSQVAAVMLDGYASFKTGHWRLGRLRTLVFSGCCITKKVHCDYQPSLPFAVVTNRSISLEGNKWWSGAITDRVKYVVCVKIEVWE